MMGKRTQLSMFAEEDPGQRWAKDKGLKRVAGVDEAGRGPLAGPVYAAAVVLDPAHPIEGLDDSKKLTAKSRDGLAEVIRQKALGFGIGVATALEIDELNILQATKLAMKRAVQALTTSCDGLIIDGNQTISHELPQTAIVKGDSRCPAIAAASILAKTSRDDVMVAMEETYPGYGFSQHKGYGTAKHLAALTQLGVTPEHRRSFAPVRQALTDSEKHSAAAAPARQQVEAAVD